MRWLEAPVRRDGGRHSPIGGHRARRRSVRAAAGAICFQTGPGQCTGPNRVFLGIGTACNPPGVFGSPCCKADYNHNGVVSVQDIFDFIAGYFAGDPCADTNGNGALSVQDIFDFIATFFAQCHN